MNLRDAFAQAEIINNGKNTPKGSHTYMGFGWKIRNRYMNLILEILENMGYEEWNFSDLISPTDFDTMNSDIMDIGKKSMFIDDKNRDGETDQRQILAPTHEIPIYASLRDQIQYASDLPLKFVHTGSAYRRPKKYAFPFSLGERRSFIEGHGIYEDSQQAKAQIEHIQRAIIEIMQDKLNVPFIESERPLLTNNPISKHTLCQDIILPNFGRTQIAGMTYFHDDIFAKPFGVSYKKHEENYEKKHTPSGLHFGFSDNLLLGTIVGSFIETDNRFQLPDVLIPYHVVILVEDEVSPKLLKDTINILKTQGLRHKVIHTTGKSDKKKKYKKLAVQGTPVVIGLNYNGKVSLNIGDIGGVGGMHQSIAPGDIAELSAQALEIRKKNRENRTQETYKETIVNGNDLSIDKINELLSQGKIIQIFMKQDDKIVLEFEKKMKHGEVLGFQNTAAQGRCVYTGEDVNTIASLSKRF